MTTGRSLIRSLKATANAKSPMASRENQAGALAPALTPPRTRNATRSLNTTPSSTMPSRPPHIRALGTDAASHETITRPPSPPASRPSSRGPGTQWASQSVHVLLSTPLQASPLTPSEPSEPDWPPVPRHKPSTPFLSSPSGPLLWDAHRGPSVSQLMPPPPIPGPARPSSASQDEKTASDHKAQPPRPPNAWILYRSDKLKAIAAGEVVPGVADLIKEQSNRSGSAAASTSASSGEESGKGKGKAKAGPVKPRKGAKEVSEGVLKLGSGKNGRGLPQAKISTLISAMWRQESKEVRAKYERMSDAKKLEHQAKYPNYKFQPMRKQDKAKLKWDKEMERQAAKEERDRERERERASMPHVGPGRPIRNRVRPQQVSPYKAPRPGLPDDGPFRNAPLTIARALTFPGDDERRIDKRPRDHTAESIAAGTTVFWANEDTYAPPPPGLQQPPPQPSNSHNEFLSLSYDNAMPRGQWEFSSLPEHSGRYQQPSQSFQMPPESMQSDQEYQPLGSTPRPERGFLVVPGPPTGDGQEAYGPPAWEANFYHQPYAVPYMFEPLPLPDDLVINDNVAYDDDGMQDSKSLAAMWCLLEEEADAGSMLPAWDADSSDAVNQWSELADLPDDSEPTGIDLSSSLASRIASSWAQEQNLDHPKSTPGLQSTAFMPGDGYLSFQYDAAESTLDGQNQTLFEAMPLSPADGTCTPDTAPMGESNTGGNRRISAAVSDFGVPPATPADLGLQPTGSMNSLTFIRHVSNSAYPQPTLLESGEEEGIGEWAEMKGSALGGLPAPLSFGTGPVKEGTKEHEDFAWDEEDAEPRALSFGAQAAPNHRRGRVVASAFRGAVGGD